MNFADYGVVAVVSVTAIGIVAVSVYAVYKLYQYVFGIDDDSVAYEQDEGDGT